MAKRWRCIRTDVMQNMERERDLCIQSELEDHDTLHHLIQKYTPTYPELRRILHPLGDFTDDPTSERGLLSDKYARTTINQFNRLQYTGQEIAAIKQDYMTVDKKIHKVWFLYLVTGDHAKQAAKRSELMIKGAEQKIDRLMKKARNQAKFDALIRQKEKEIEVKLKKRRGKGGSNP